MSNIAFPSALEQKVSNIFNGTQGLAAEGSLLIATSPTPGTGIAITTSVVDDAATASSTHGQFAPALLILNQNQATSSPIGKSIYPLYIKLVTTAIPTSATAWKGSFRLANNSANYVSGGTQLVPQNLNTAFGNGTGAAVYFGAIVPAQVPGASGRLVGSDALSNVIPVIGETYYFTFGDVSLPTNTLVESTTARVVTLPHAAIAIAPGWSLQLDLWGASNAAAAAYEVELCYVER
jgi:hypothetical protein